MENTGKYDSGINFPKDLVSSNCPIVSPISIRSDILYVTDPYKLDPIFSTVDIASNKV